MEVMAFLREWLRRMPEFRLAPDRQPRMKGGNVGALTELWLSWE
jgi:hypothetical protein